MFVRRTLLSYFRLCLVCWSLLALSLRGAGAEEPKGPARWEKEIAALEEADRTLPRPLNPVLFVGSSSIRLWKVAESFPDLPVINHGFGGSQYADAAYFAERLVVPLQPAIVVLYSGDNDIASGKSADQVLADLTKLVTLIHEHLPKTRVVVIGVKPSIKRWAKIETVRETNRQMQAWLAQDSRRSFVDVDPPMLGADGKPRPELFLEDGLHLNATGYALWTGLVRPHLEPVPSVANDNESTGEVAGGEAADGGRDGDGNEMVGRRVWRGGRKYLRSSRVLGR